MIFGRSFTLFLILLFISSCSKDPCDDCLNGSACEDGICICPDGYAGENCQYQVGYHCTSSECISVLVVDGMWESYVYTSYQLCVFNCSGAGGGGTDCDDTCFFANDGICSDDAILCDPGTDCSDCGGPLGGGYNCESSGCVNVSSGGQYGSLVICEVECTSGGGGGGTDGYNCDNGNCSYVSSNAQYGTLSSCENNCSGGGSTDGYNCYTGNCLYVPSNADYGSRSECEDNCMVESTGDVKFIFGSDWSCGPTEISFSSRNNQTLQYFFPKPYCFSSVSGNSAKFSNLPYGVYDYEVISLDGYCYRSGSIEVDEDCKLVELEDFGDKGFTVWTDRDFGCGVLTVELWYNYNIINGPPKDLRATAQIDSYYDGFPGCFSSGCANFSLDEWSSANEMTVSNADGQCYNFYGSITPATIGYNPTISCHEIKVVF